MDLPKDYLVRDFRAPSIRYHDTSFIIFRKWFKGREELAFPSIHKCITSIRPSSVKVDHHLTDTECNCSEGNKDEAVKKNRRRTKSLEKRKRPEDLPLRFSDKPIESGDDQNNNALRHETIKLHIVELEPINNNNNNNSSISRNAVSRRKSQPNPSDKLNHVVADVHRPNSEALVITEQEYTKDGEPDEDSEAPSNRSSRAGDSSDRTIRSEPYTNRPTQLGSSSPRKRLHRGACDSLISTSSTDDLDEDDVVDYATVDLRKTIRVSSTDGQRTLRKSNDESREHNTIPKSQSFPVKSKHHQQISDSLRLHYVTQRVLASVLPRRDPQDPSVNRPHSDEHGVLPDKYEKEVISMLKQKHGMNYRVFDLESCISVVTLERICELCKHIDKWLNSGQDKVVVLQDRGDRQRLGTAIAAYLEYLDICASNFTTRSGASNEDLRAQNTIARNWLALDVFSMKKFLEDFIGPLRIPSHKRYLKYFSGLLSGRIKMNSSPLFLKFITVESPPSWLHYSRYSTQNEWSSFIKIYEGLRCIYTSDIHIIPITTRQFLYQVGNLRLRGDILIRCYQICPPDSNSYNQESRELLCSVQFHTCAITSSEVSFPKDELDFAHDDPRFPKDHKVTLHFHSGAVTDNGFVFQSPLIRTEPANELTRADSIENMNISSSCHTQGPLDGSLYATILKSPKSPSPPQKTTNYNSTSQRNSFTQNLISPPPQFSNKQFQVVERRPVTSTPIRNSVDSNNRRETSTTSTLRSPSQPRSDYSYVESRPGTSQSNYRTQNSYPSGSQQVTIVETYHTNETGHNQNYQNGGRESVRSPLTLSMDSGISSSGVLNRPQQGSSVSPSSFPSQASPQEDRHRELDDILSDMLMTVQDIPDFSKGYSKQTSQKIVRSQSVIPSSSSVNYVLPVQNKNYSRDTAARSQSCIPHGHETGSSYLTKERDHYDTSSTTTLTPPPSESGRDTPVAGGYTSNSSNISTLQHRQVLYRDKREVYTTNTTSNNSTIMDQQHQSSVYPQPVRTESVSVPGASEDEENIPYHAREHSQPFTYGNVPLNGQSELVECNTTDPRMIKMQSGLSSPSLVRKTIGTSQTLRKTSPRNDFEEMLRERREKVMSEKYSISDKTSASGFDKAYDRYYSTETWNKGQPNGYHYYNEPLKRSNTLDGFHRSTSSDGLSGQTWLQLQQQKLRAKKGQQYAADRKYFDEVIHTEIRNRPLRTRPVQRYDGYASDTAAFGDEVDYRRPLHVQTPSRSPERTFRTVTTTTTVTKERPFVAVKRAHEQARQERIGSPPLSPLSVLNASPNGQIAQAQNGLLSMADSPRSGQVRLTREESFSSYRSETDPELSIAGSPRPETPAFPVTPRTPYGLSSNGSVSPALPPKSPTSQRRLYNSTWSLRSQKYSTSTLDTSKDLYTGAQKNQLHEIINQNDVISYTTRRNSNASTSNSEPQEVAPHHVKFVRDSSKYWYKPTISREEAVGLLRNATPGTFIVRDSTTFKNAFGLVVRVSHPPPGVTSAGQSGDELVRHFLVEPTTRGVRLKGCANEPVFTSLSALVYQHSITPLALPCRLIIPDRDIQAVDQTPAQRQLLAQGAACNVFYLYACDTESLTGEEAVRKAVSQLYSSKPLPTPTEVHFKVSLQGITLTDVTRQKFFRKHYTANAISFCGPDPERRVWSVKSTDGDVPVNNKTIFAFVARRSASSSDNQCHVFCDISPNQPATAIVSFANKTLPTEKIITTDHI